MRLVSLTALLLSIMVIAVGGFLFVSAAMAETYLYVDANGELRSIVADNPIEAIATAPNKAPTSGVIIASSFGSVGGLSSVADMSGSSETYLYVDVNGDLQPVTADNPEQAIALAVDRAPTSGVMLVI